MKSFTLLETIITIAVFAIIIGAVFSAIVAVYKTHNYSWQQSVAIDEARRGIKTMTREIREAKPGDNGSYPIEKAGDKEFIFYSDIDKDNDIERVRYFIGSTNSGSQIKECVTFTKGGSCSVNFSNFLQGTLILAQIKVSVEGDLGMNQEYGEIYVDAGYVERICRTSCSDCASVWQGDSTYNVTLQASDNSLEVLVDATNSVDPLCNWQDPNHSMKVKVELLWEEEVVGADALFKKGVINPTSFPVEYPIDQEEVSVISYYVRNAPPIFEYFYFDTNLNELKKIEEYPAKLKDTKVMKVFLVVNVDPSRAPQDFELESFIQLRNLKE